MVQCFSLTIKQHQPVYQPQKSSSEQHVDSSIAGNRSLNYSDPWFSGPAEKLQHCLRPATSWNRGNVPRDKLFFTREFCVQKLLSLIDNVKKSNNDKLYDKPI